MILNLDELFSWSAWLDLFHLFVLYTLFFLKCVNFYLQSQYLLIRETYIIQGKNWSVILSHVDA